MRISGIYASALGRLDPKPKRGTPPLIVAGREAEAVLTPQKYLESATGRLDPKLRPSTPPLFVAGREAEAVQAPLGYS